MKYEDWIKLRNSTEPAKVSPKLIKKIKVLKLPEPLPEDDIHPEDFKHPDW